MGGFTSAVVSSALVRSLCALRNASNHGVADGRLYICGGVQCTGAEPLCTAERFQPWCGRWEALHLRWCPVHWCGASVHCGTLPTMVWQMGGFTSAVVSSALVRSLCA